MSDFVHLHNHTDYSLLDAAQSVESMVSRLSDLKMDSIAVTEHGNLFSLIPFYKSARAAGIKPILGCEVYVSVGSYKEKKLQNLEGVKKWGYHHLVLLAMNNTGFSNLMKLVSIGYLEGYYYRPRIDKDLLRQYNEGLIATSACLAGEVTHYASVGNYEKAKEAALEYCEIFPNRFYIEIQNHGINGELSSHKILKKLSSELDIPLVATNDCHYSHEEHSDAHDTLFCLGMGKDKRDTNRPKYAEKQFYIKSLDEMHAIFKDTPGAIENSLRIAEQCNVTIDMDQYHLPNFPIPDNEALNNPDDYLKKICVEGIKSKYKEEHHAAAMQRLDYELGVIKKMGFAGYFLITQDFVQYAKNSAIPVGPGRGSAVGSLVAYSTGITNIDPLKYNLIFERFLNPDRVTMPDIDIDFCIQGRDKVIDYIKNKYGHDSVAQIITFGTMKAKSVIRDVGRVLGISYAETDKIAKMIPNDLKMTLDKAMKMNPEFGKVSEISESHKNLIEHSKTLEGLHRHASTHAAGIVVTPGPLTNYVPLFKNPSTGDVATQVDMKGLEDLGILKMDFLGLRNLTVIDKTITMIKTNHNEFIDIDNLVLNEDAVMGLFAKGLTTGIFQFESAGMKEYLKQLKPSTFEELVAMNALYRPGPMSNIPKFINRKHGKEKIQYIHKSLEPILKETYGIIVYQEQVMEIGAKIGGLSLSQSDEMRRAMGKKKKNLMATFKIDFVEGAHKQKIDKKIASEIFSLLEKFAQYGFNKSHSTAYAMIAYQTAWLKVNFPAEFMSANMSTEMNDTDRIATLLSASNEMKLTVLPPDINSSLAEFSTTKSGKILYGLAAIKNVGTKAAEGIALYRKKHGHFNHIEDLCSVDSTSLNKKVLESLIQSGALDCLEGNRAEKFEHIDVIIKINQKKNQDKKLNQESLFGNEQNIQKLSFPSVEEWGNSETARREKEALGFYLMSNPLKKYENDLKDFSNLGVNEENQSNKEIRCGGIVQDVTVRYDKKNRKWAIVNLNLLIGSCEIYVFYELYEKHSHQLVEDEKLFFVGNPSTYGDDKENNRMVATAIHPLQDVRKTLSKTVNILLSFGVDDKNEFKKIKDLCQKNVGNCRLVFHLAADNGLKRKVLANNIQVNSSHHLIASLRAILGKNNVWIS